MEHYQTSNPDVWYPVFRTYWGAIFHMLPSAIFNPGVGMNLGAPRPKDQSQPIDLTFVENETQETKAADDSSAVQ